MSGLRFHRSLLVVVVMGAMFAFYLEYRTPSSTPDTANGGGPNDGARDVTSSHPLPNETADPRPTSRCGAVPGR